jgi:rhodanese-related sulfurtransferase
MELLAVGLAALALVVALLAFRRAGGGGRGLEEAAADARRRVENAREELNGELALQRRLLARMAAGAKLTPEMVVEGRLWDDVDARAAGPAVAEGRWRVLDVRTPRECASGMLAGAVRIPIEELEVRVGELPRDGKPLLVYCASGARSAAACELLTREGFDELHNLQGGISAWPHGTVKPAGA